MRSKRWAWFGSATLLVMAAMAGVGPLPGDSQAAMTVNVANATVGGQSRQILVDGKGLALYYLTSDTATTSACTGGCAGFWPPLTSTGTPTGPSSLPGKLAVVKTANGSQVTYNGHPLYRYAPDTKPGDVGGDGKPGPQNGTWHVATPAMPAM